MINEGSKNRHFGIGLTALFCLFVLVPFSFAQSTTQDFPTPVTTNEIEGTIKARDIGDARLTTYFFTFNGTQGDLFINVNTQNFNGDIDVFIADNLNPVTKIVMYADSSVNETGRVVYLRQPVKLILRVEGRTPGDDPATFRIKFAGSFLASTDTGREQPTLPKVTTENEAGIKVNSVGTIIETPPKRAEVAKTTEEPSVEAKKAEEEKPVEEKTETETKKVEVVVTEGVKPAKTSTAKKAPPVRTVGRRRTPPKRTTTAKAAAPENAPPKEKTPDPLENVHLVIEFKDGKRIERKMSDVLRFTVDKGILTVISKDGTIGRYNILDVVRTTIE